MAARKKEQKINLLPREGFASTTTGRILIWLVTTFRILVMLTLVIVWIFFLFRFWLDMKISDLDDSIEEKQEEILSYQDFEKNFLAVQKKLTYYSEFIQTGTQTSEFAETVRTQIPDDVILVSTSISKSGDLSIEAETPTEKSILQFIVNLNSTEKFENFEISKLTFNPDSNLLLFNIKSKLKAKGGNS